MNLYAAAAAAALALLQTTLAAECKNVVPNGHWPSNEANFEWKLPEPSGGFEYVFKPPWMTDDCQMWELQEYCVEKASDSRAANGLSRLGDVGTAALMQSEAALSALALHDGTCDGWADFIWKASGPYGGYASPCCPGDGVNSMASAKTFIDNCFKWHHDTNPETKYIGCGMAFTFSGRMFLTRRYGVSFYEPKLTEEPAPSQAPTPYPTVDPRTCTNTAPQGWFRGDSHVWKNGMPPKLKGRTFVDRPKNLSKCQLERLQRRCIDRVNMFRSGQMGFTDQAGDPLEDPLAEPVKNGLKPYNEALSERACANEFTLSELYTSVERDRGCSGAHSHVWACNSRPNREFQPWGGNSCCHRGFDVNNVYEDVLENVYGCLQGMWNEGIPENVAAGGVTGHYDSMASSSMTAGICGFAFTEEGDLYMNQNYGDYTGETRPPTGPPVDVPTSESPTKRPTSKSPTKRPTSKSPTKRPTSKSPTKRPTSKSPTSRPTSDGEICTDTCIYRRDNECDDTVYCEWGTDCTDCGPRRITDAPSPNPTPKPTTFKPTPKPTTRAPTSTPNSSPTLKPTIKTEYEYEDDPEYEEPRLIASGGYAEEGVDCVHPIDSSLVQCAEFRPSENFPKVKKTKAPRPPSLFPETRGWCYTGPGKYKSNSKSKRYKWAYCIVEGTDSPPSEYEYETEEEYEKIPTSAPTFAKCDARQCGAFSNKSKEKCLGKPQFKYGCVCTRYVKNKCKP